ncbi:MAG: chorismate mutase [Candidatus Dojkabacteria bacterium]
MNTLDSLRQEIDTIDKSIIDQLKHRIAVAKVIGDYKKANNLPVYQPEREKLVIEAKRELAKQAGLDEELVEKLFTEIIKYCRKIQEP